MDGHVTPVTTRTIKGGIPKQEGVFPKKGIVKMSCTNPFCQCYWEGVRDGYQLGYKRGYVNGYVDASLGIEPPSMFKAAIEERRRRVTADYDAATLKPLSFTRPCRRPTCRALGYCDCP